MTISNFAQALATFALKTLLFRARNIPSTSKGKREEAQRVKAVLRENNYPSGFIKECERALATKPSQPTTNGYVVLPYVKGVSERICRVLKLATKFASFLPATENHQQSFSSTQTAGWNRPSFIWNSVQNQLQSMRFCILWPDRKSTEDADFWAQKGCSDVRP